MLKRSIIADVIAALKDSPVVLLNGARQTGKSTLVQQIAAEHHPARYVTLDDATLLAAAQGDPDGFIQAFDGPVIIDEVQRVPDIFRAIKACVDRDRQPGQFLLTGSADVFLLPRLSESLAGRMEILTLWPFSQGELAGHSERFVDVLFEERLPRHVAVTGSYDALVRRVLKGGYPEAQQRSTEKRRKAWFNAYVTTLLQRDIRDLANIANLTTLPRVLALLAARVGSTVNYAELGRSSGVPQTTLKRYMALLEATFLLYSLPAWSANISKRLVKAPKLMLTDAGLMAQLVGISEASIGLNRQRFGAVLENFVVMECVKQVSWSERQPRLFHFRTQKGQEVDVVLEDATGELVGVEVKASVQVKPSDFKGLRVLAEAAGTAFRRGVVLYAGEEVVRFGDGLYAVPLPAVWTW